VDELRDIRVRSLTNLLTSTRFSTRGVARCSIRPSNEYNWWPTVAVIASFMGNPMHHIRRNAAPSTQAAFRPGSPWRAVQVRELRYSSERLRSATLEGRRPLPQEVRRSVAVYSFARSNARGGAVAALAHIEERRARQTTRRQLDLVRTGLVTDTEIETGRHRHSARWLA
jgi:hypothetical protein